MLTKIVDQSIFSLKDSLVFIKKTREVFIKVIKVHGEKGQHVWIHSRKVKTELKPSDFYRNYICRYESKRTNDSINLIMLYCAFKPYCFNLLPETEDYCFANFVKAQECH